MRVICCRCSKHLRDTPSSAFGPDDTSHGLCEPCAVRFLAETGVTLHEYLESLPVPAAVVNPDRVVSSANKAALRMLGKTPSEIQGARGGDVFECRYAELPGGCGNTIHCSGCTIRNTVMDTMLTGKTHKKVPAYLQRGSDDAPGRIALLISTEKRGGVVFLQIEDIREQTASPLHLLD